VAGNIVAVASGVMYSHVQRNVILLASAWRNGQHQQPAHRRDSSIGLAASAFSGFWQLAIVAASGQPYVWQRMQYS